MLIVSVALHLGVAAGIALSYFHGTAVPALTSFQETTPASTVMLLRSQDISRISQTVQANPAGSAITAALSSRLPLPSPAVTEKTHPAATSPAALAVETNPNANVHAAPPDAVLSPTPAPRLNGADGVVFILDISGSMYEPYNGTTRLALARQTLSRQILALKDGTPFAITLYALRATTSGPLVAANDATRGGRSPFHHARCRLRRRHESAGRPGCAQQLHTGALVLISDGDLNMSTSNLTTRTAAILGPRDQCPSLTILGIAPRMDAGAERLMQKLADHQGGSYATEQPDGNAELLSSAANLIKPASATP